MQEHRSENFALYLGRIGGETTLLATKGTEAFIIQGKWKGLSDAVIVYMAVSMENPRGVPRSLFATIPTTSRQPGKGPGVSAPGQV